MNYIHETAIIYPNVVIGDNVYIGAYCVIGSPAEHPDKVDPRNYDYDNSFGVIIGDNVVIRELCTVQSGVAQTTIIERDCYIMSHTRVGHDAYVKDSCRAHGHNTIAAHSIIGRLSRIGIGAHLHPSTMIAAGTMIGVSSFVKGEWTDEFRILAGSPAKDIGPNQRLIDKLKNV